MLKSFTEWKDITQFLFGGDPSGGYVAEGFEGGETGYIWASSSRGKKMLQKWEWRGRDS